MISQLRLYVIYALIAIAIIGAGIGVSAKFSQKEMENTLERQADTIEKQRVDLSVLEDARKADTAVISALQSDVQNISANNSAAQSRIRTLENTNAEIKSFLNLALPDGGCVLDNSCRKSNAGSRPAAKLPAAGSGRGKNGT